ncbi:hypothetical protein ACLOJK_001193 [Asimina triloba]
MRKKRWSTNRRPLERDPDIEAKKQSMGAHLDVPIKRMVKMKSARIRRFIGVVGDAKNGRIETIARSSSVVMEYSPRL